MCVDSGVNAVNVLSCSVNGLRPMHPISCHHPTPINPFVFVFVSYICSIDRSLTAIQSVAFMVLNIYAILDGKIAFFDQKLAHQLQNHLDFLLPAYFLGLLKVLINGSNQSDRQRDQITLHLDSIRLHRLDWVGLDEMRLAQRR